MTTRTVVEGQIYKSLSGPYRLVVEYVLDLKVPPKGLVTKALCEILYDDQGKPPKRVYVQVSSLKNRKKYQPMPLDSRSTESGQ